MSYFNHGEWAAIQADLELQPLSKWAPDVVARLLAGEVFQFPSELSYEQEVLQRLYDLDLVEGAGWEWEGDGEVRASDSLRSIEARGLVGELTGETVAA
jgi:hypothetical protein